MSKKPPFQVDGTSCTQASDGGVDYGVWRVLTREGAFVCGFFGPNSLACAQFAYEAMNKADACLTPDVSVFA